MSFHSRTNLRKLLFVLPNLFTVSSIFCGFYAIVVLSQGDLGGQDIYKAALLIFFATFFDTFDGRVARMTRTQSDFGKELDSLADVISFGVAPGLLAYQWGLYKLGILGVLAAFVFPVCGALRLARFNVIASRAGKDASKFFTGLPIPLAAGTLVSVIIAHHLSDAGSVRAGWVGVFVLLLATLMVSNVRYRTFKDISFSPRNITIFLLIIAMGVIISIQVRASFALVAYFSLYISLGLAEEAIHLHKRRRERLALTSGTDEALDEGTDDDEIVLAEEEVEDEEEGEEDNDAEPEDEPLNSP